MIVFLTAAATLAGTAAVRDSKVNSQTPVQLERLMACRSIPDSNQRLICFDRETAATAEAIARKDLVAVDRENMRQTRRSLFGFSVPKLGIFGGDDDKDEIKQIDGVIAGITSTLNGVRVRLQDDSRWAQTDGKPIAIEPQAGDKVVIKRGALGSYVMSIAGQPGVKVVRLN